MLVAVTVLGALLRFGSLAIVYPLGTTGDEVYYTSTAVQIARGEGHVFPPSASVAGWPPAHPFLLSLSIDAALTRGPDARNAVLIRLLMVEAGLASALVALIACLGWTLFDSRTGVLAGLFAALFPTFIAYGHYLWSETLLLVLEVGGLLAAALAARSGRWAPVLAAGACFGAAALTREVGGLFAACVGLWWLFTGVPVAHPIALRGQARRRALARAVVLLAVTGAVIAPWTLRNYTQLHHFVPVSTVGWMGMREGNTLSGPSWLRPDLTTLFAFRARYFAIPSEVERMDMARGEALELIRAEQPSWLVKKSVRNGALLFAPDSFLFKKLSRGSYGEVGIGVVRGLLIITCLAYLAVMAGGAFGLAAARVRGQKLMPLLVFGTIVALHTLANASSRYRLPIMPLMLIYAGHAVLQRSALMSLPRNVLLTCCVPVGVVVAWGCVYFWPDAIALWNTGAYVSPNRP